MVRIASAPVFILLLIASIATAYPATEHELSAIIQSCEGGACSVSSAECESACALEKNECTSNCRGAMSACFNQCEIARQGCVAGCGTARSACVEACLGAEGLDGCLHLYDSASPDPFIICAMSHEPGPAPAETPTPRASATPSPQATATPSPHSPQPCAEGTYWNGTGCVPIEIPQSASCPAGFALATVIAFALFARNKRL